MKITTLMENTAGSECFTAEHGLSIYIETKEHIILFDSGPSGAFANNAAKLGVDLAKVEMAILSHGHYDHGGGLLRFMEKNKTAPIYMSAYAFEPHLKNSGTEDIGLDPALQGKAQIRFINGKTKLAEGITLYSCNDRKLVCPIDTSGMQVKRDGKLYPEDFRHEQYLLIEENGKRVLFSGCSHKGILNIANWFRPDVLIGGFHFMGVALDDAGKKRLAEAAENLCSYPTTYYTCHCTGLDQYRFMKQLMGDRLHYLATGDIVEI